MHPGTGKTTTSYKKLANGPVTKEVWMKALGKEFGSLEQSNDLTKTSGTNSLFIMDHGQIKKILSDQMITYARIVVDFQQQKADPNWVQITAGGIQVSSRPGPQI